VYSLLGLYIQNTEEHFESDRGFLKVQSTQFQMLNNNNDVTVQVSKDDIDWMEDVTMKPNLYVSDL